MLFNLAHHDGKFAKRKLTLRHFSSWKKILVLVVILLMALY